ncbi:MAG: ABC transporter substrate-binding protein [Rubrimonas sp.]
MTIRFSGRAAVAPVALGAALMAGAAGAQTITAVMHSGLRVTDPIITTAHITRNHGYMIYDTLLATDENFEVQPQMASVEVSEDGLTYTFTLRDGLSWHDGEPVTPADCIASLKRWMARDTGGQLIADRMASLEATGDNTFQLVLNEPFGDTLEIIAKPSSIVPFMMPERIASTPADTAITEFVGSGPFVMVTAEFQPGVRVVYEKFEGYVPREEPQSWGAGRKEVLVDRVEWVTMPDAQTAINALMAGEIDFYESPPVDLLPILQSNPDITVEVLATLGYQTMGRMNFKHPPFDDKRIRQAAMTALSQENVLNALIGNPEYYRTCGAMLGCGTPLGSETGAESLLAGGDAAAARAMLQEAGYDGTPIVIMHPTDVVTVAPQPVVAAQALREAGFTVDLQPMDWQTLVTRRASQAAPADGGWNMFFTNWIVPEITTPLNNVMLNGRGDQAWFGWPDDPQLEALRAEYVAAQGPEARREVAERIQAHAMDEVIYVPLGQYMTPWAWTQALDGLREAPWPVFWGVTKAD